LWVTFTGLNKHTSLLCNAYITSLYCFIVLAPSLKFAVDARCLGGLLTLPVNIRLDWRGLYVTNNIPYSSMMKKKVYYFYILYDSLSFYLRKDRNFGPVIQKLFFLISYSVWFSRQCENLLSLGAYPWSWDRWSTRAVF
jgi:hypothetical protein